MPHTRDVFNHNNKELVEIKWSCKGSANLSESALLEFVETGICLFFSLPWPLWTGDTYLHPSRHCIYLFVLIPPYKENCMPADFITTTLNYTVLGPSNYSFLRCGHVEKGHKSTEVQAPGLELWENWKQMISPFLYPFTHIPLSNTLHFCPPSLASKTMKEQLNSWKQEHVWSVWSAWFRDCAGATFSLNRASISSVRHFFVCLFYPPPPNKSLKNCWIVQTDYVVQPWWVVVQGDSWMGSGLSVCWTLCDCL